MRNRIATRDVQGLVVPFSRFGVIHGDPHLGNYTVFAEGGEPAGINLLDYGCIRIFPPNFVGGVVDLYHGPAARTTTTASSTPTRPGASSGSTRELIDILNIWARFIYGPLLDDRVRTIADGVKPAEYGRREAFRVHQALKEKGPVTVPREFVFMDRAAIGLGGVFLHLAPSSISTACSTRRSSTSRSRAWPSASRPRSPQAGLAEAADRRFRLRCRARRPCVATAVCRLAQRAVRAP